MVSREDMSREHRTHSPTIEIVLRSVRMTTTPVFVIGSYTIIILVEFYSRGFQFLNSWLFAVAIFTMLLLLLNVGIFNSDTHSLRSTVNLELRRLNKVNEQLYYDLSNISEELHHYFLAESFNLDPASLAFHRYVPVRVYISNGDKIAVDLVSNALERAVRVLGLDITDRFPAEGGSWFKKVFARTQKAVTSEQFQRELKKQMEMLVHAAETLTVDKQQALNDGERSTAVVNLMTALGSSPNAVLQVGSILLLKLTDANGVSTSICRTLSPRQMIMLENEPALLKNPTTVLEYLAISHDESVPS